MIDEDFQVRVGKIRSRGVAGPRTFVGTALAAAQRAGGIYRAAARSGSSFGRGQVAVLLAGRGAGGRARVVIVKARVVRHRATRGGLGLHLKYLQREGVTREADVGQVFDARETAADGVAFAERCTEDRHHFRFIVAPEDAAQLSYLKAFARDLMSQAERDLGTRLDWVAVDHWNTGHPHIHILVRGRTEKGDDLVIARDYISNGLRARASELATLELGLRTDQDLRRSLEQQVGADRWTGLDRRIAASINPDGLIDLRRGGSQGHDEERVARIGRLRKLESFGLAQEVRPSRWRLASDAEPVLRSLGARGDIIARMHRALGEGGDHDPSRYVLDREDCAAVVGRLAGRGLDDELSGSGYVIVEGLDGRAHHVALRELDIAADAPIGSIIEIGEAQGGRRPADLRLRVRSDLVLADQIKADGATWLDRRLVGSAPESLGRGGFADEVRAALTARASHLEAEGLARRSGRRVVFARDLLATLRSRELAAAASRVETASGLPHQPLGEEGTISGVYRRRLDLASGRFAMIDNGLGFTLVPWRTDMERHLGREIIGARNAAGGIDWSFGQARGLAR